MYARAVVPYVAYGLSRNKRRGTNLWKYRAAANVVSELYKRRKAFIGAARGAKKMLAYSRQKYHKYAKIRAKKVGFKKGAGTAKRHEVLGSLVLSQDSRSLYVDDVTTIPRGDNLNQRERHSVFLSGFKICFEVKNRTASPAMFHWAIIAPKQNTTVNNTDFFRAKDGDLRSVDFGNTLSSNEMNCLPINQDKYNIIVRSKKQLVAGAAGGTTVSLSGKSWCFIEDYVPIKRQIRFNSATANDTNNKFYLVYWFEEMFIPAGSASFANAFNIQKKVTCYFREPQPVMRY